ncbi:TPA: hypothetical protein ACH9TM_005729, partial [Escherichia coli]
TKDIQTRTPDKTINVRPAIIPFLGPFLSEYRPEDALDNNVEIDSTEITPPTNKGDKCNILFTNKGNIASDNPKHIIATNRILATQLAAS